MPPINHLKTHSLRHFYIVASYKSKGSFIRIYLIVLADLIHEDGFMIKEQVCTDARFVDHTLLAIAWSI